MTTIRAVYFDAVGTLIHPEPAAHLVYEDVGRQFGSRYSSNVIAQRFVHAFQKQEEIDRHNGWITSEQREIMRWRAIVGEVLDDAADPTQCFEQLYEHFRRPDAWRCEAGIETLLAALLDDGYRIGLASNFDARLYALIDALPPLRHFVAPIGVNSGVVVSSTAGVRKPAKEFFQIMCSQAGIDATRVLYVGDNPENDYDGARAAGLRAVLFDPRGQYDDSGSACIRQLDGVRESLRRPVP